MGRTQRVTEPGDGAPGAGPANGQGEWAAPGFLEVGASHLQTAQGAEAQEVARFLREALAEAGGRPLHSAGELRRDVGQRQAPVQPQLPVPRSTPAPPDAAHRAESPRRGRRGRRPGQASQRHRVRPRIHPSSQAPKVSEPRFRSRRPATEFGKGSELQLPDGPATAGPLKRCLRVLGKPQANRMGTRNHGPQASPRCARGQRRLRKAVFSFLLTPGNFRWESPGPAPEDSLAANQNYVPQKALRYQQL